ncbi:Uncharacterised protein [Achromobacter sp. 2789STDY5608615]|nr:Uncharacterised protein [Achromobacter sp. 2789STDY5608621]CUK22808.1 Uncharacterised protein [Achromobacter sp. 2789STDY5608615]
MPPPLTPLAPGFCSTSVLLPLAPPSTRPSAEKFNATFAPSPFRLAPTPMLVAPPWLTDEPVTAVKVLVLLMPMCTLPLMVPALVKVLPETERPRPTRPLMTAPAALVTVIGAPP